MLMNSPSHTTVIKSYMAAKERGRLLSEYARNIDRLISFNNRRIALGMRPFNFPTALVKAGRDLLRAA